MRKEMRRRFSSMTSGLVVIAGERMISTRYMPFSRTRRLICPQSSPRAESVAVCSAGLLADVGASGHESLALEDGQPPLEEQGRVQAQEEDGAGEASGLAEGVVQQLVRPDGELFEELRHQHHPAVALVRGRDNVGL